MSKVYLSLISGVLFTSSITVFPSSEAGLVARTLLRAGSLAFSAGQGYDEYKDSLENQLQNSSAVGKFVEKTKKLVKDSLPFLNKGGEISSVASQNHFNRAAFRLGTSALAHFVLGSFFYAIREHERKTLKKMKKKEIETTWNHYLKTKAPRIILWGILLGGGIAGYKLLSHKKFQAEADLLAKSLGVAYGCEMICGIF